MRFYQHQRDIDAVGRVSAADPGGAGDANEAAGVVGSGSAGAWDAGQASLRQDQRGPGEPQADRDGQVTAGGPGRIAAASGQLVAHRSSHGAR